MRMFSRRIRRTTVAVSVTALAGVVAPLVITVPALADTARYQATFVEPVGGPNQSPFSCPPGTACGSANIAFGHAANDVLVFGACGPDCHVRTVTFADGSTLVINEIGPISDFTSPGSAGSHGYNGLGLPGNPQFLNITQTIVGGSGRFAGATGTATGTVKVAGGVAIITASGTITLP